MIEDIKQAISNAVDILNWSPGNDGHFLYAAARLHDHYNKAAKHWSESDYPPTQVVTLAWITSTSAVKASMLWLQDMSLAIQSLNAFEYEHDRILSEAEAHEMIREALREWHQFAPSNEEASKMRTMIMAQLTVEHSSIISNYLLLTKKKLCIDFGNIVDKTLRRMIDEKKIRVIEGKKTDKELRIHRQDYELFLKHPDRKPT